MIQHNFRKAFVSAPGMATLFTLSLVASFWLVGVHTAVGLLVSLAVGLPLGINTATKIRKMSAYSLQYIESGDYPKLRQFAKFYHTAAIPSDETEREEYVAYLDGYEHASYRAMKQAPFIIALMVLGNVALISHRHITLWNALDTLIVGFLIHSYIKTKIAVARVPVLKQRALSSTPHPQSHNNHTESWRPIARQYPWLYAYAAVKLLVVLAPVIASRRSFFVALTPIAHHTAAYVAAVLSVNAIGILYLLLPVYIVISKNMYGILYAFSVLLSLLLLGVFLAILRADYWGVVLEIMQISFTIILLAVLARDAAKVPQ